MRAALAAAVMAGIALSGCDRDGPSRERSKGRAAEAARSQPATTSTVPGTNRDARANNAALPEALTEIAGTGVRLRLPAGFRRHAQTGVYVNPKTGATIGAMRLPGGPAEEHIRQFQAGLRQRGAELLQEDVLKLGAHRAWFCRMRQVKDGVRFRTAYVCVGRGDVTVMINANVLDSADQQEWEQLTQCVKTARWDPDAVADPMKQMEFTVKPGSKLKLDAAMPGMQSIVYRESGRSKPLKPGEATFLVLYTKLPAAPRDRRQWFNMLLQADTRSRRHSDLRVETITPINVGGLDGFEGVCTARDNARDARDLLYFAALFKSDTEFYRIWGSVASSRRRSFEREFKKMTRSLRIKSPRKGREQSR